MSNSTIVFHRLVKFILTDRVDLDSPGYHEDQRSFPTLTLGWKKQRHLDSQFDQPNKSNILTKAAINGIQAKVESKIIDFGLQFQVS